MALQTVREDVARTTENYELSHDIVRSEAKSFGERLDGAVRTAEDSADILDRDRITLGLIALAGHERDTILARVRERTISARMAEQVLSDADRLIEGARSERAKRLQPRRSAQCRLRPGVSVRPVCCTADSGCPTRWQVDRRPVRVALVPTADPAGSRRLHRRAHPPHPRRRVADLLHELLVAPDRTPSKPRWKGCACNIRAMPRNWSGGSSAGPRCGWKSANMPPCARTG